MKFVLALLVVLALPFTSEDSGTCSAGVCATLPDRSCATEGSICGTVNGVGVCTTVPGKRPGQVRCTCLDKDPVYK